ncbi:MAG: metallophosphoesterase [Proteobacteria bacterium]|nr:metallophosphoesterase [Pseudomonadota bacterium]
MQNKKLWTAVILCGVLSACSNDSSFEVKGNCTDACELGSVKCPQPGTGYLAECVKKNSCLVWESKMCADGLVCDVNAADHCVDPGTVTCTNACSEGSVECTETGYRECAKGGDSCTKWTDKKCSDGFVCDAAKKECVDPGTVACVSACTVGDSKCTDGGLAECVENADGCGEWGTPEPCEDGKVCDAGLNACVAGCDECSVHAKKCDGKAVVECYQNEDGCAVWSEPKSCGDGMYCDSESNECVAGCEDACSEGAMECEGAMVKRCVKNEQTSCLEWGVSESCGSNMHCDAATNQCVNECQDECTAGTSECVADKIRECGNFDDDACLEFSEPEDCGTDKVCVDSACVISGCAVECEVGTEKCDGTTGIVKCQDDGNGCQKWVSLKSCQSNEQCEEESDGAVCVNKTKVCEAGDKKCSDDGLGIMTCVENNAGNAWNQSGCGTNMKCDAGSITCVSSLTCTDACTENAKQCSSKGVPQTCKKGTSGCTEWVNGTACTDAQYCDKGSCAYNCGNDCDPFSIVIIPDTQNYVRYTDASKTNTTYHKQMQWIVDNKNKKDLMPNLKMVIHMGDITNDNTDVQWKIAKSAQEILRKNNVPFTVVNGNHDYRVSGAIGGRSKSKFETYFPESYLSKLPGYGGIYAKHNTWFDFHAGNQDYMVLNLEYAPRQQTLCWANSLLRKAEHENKKVIIATHANVTHDASFGGKPKLDFVAHGASGSEMWNGLTARHSNIIMVLNGHVCDSERMEKKGNQKNVVEQILTDYQFEKPCSADKVGSCTNHCAHVQDAGNGWLRILTFYPKENRVHAHTVSVISKNKSTFSKEGTDQFFCSSLYKGSDKTYDNWYPRDPQDKVHQYDFHFDFTSKKKNTYDAAGFLGFAHRNINNNGDGNQLNSSVAAAPNGSFVTVWEDDSSDADGKQYNSSTNARDIYARILNPNGCNISGNAEIVVNAGKTSGHQAEPDVAMDKNGNFVVVWTDDNDNNGSTQIYMRGFKADGSERFGIKTVNSVSTRDQTQPHIAMAPDGQFAVSWTDTKTSKNTPQIMVRGFKADGTQSFADRPITDSVAGKQIKSDIFMDSSHNVVVVWEDDSDGNGSTQAKMRILNADGSSKTGVKTVNKDATGNQNGPAVSGKPDGSLFIVTWTNIASSSATSYTIMGATFNASSTKVKTDFKLSTSSAKNQNSGVCMNEKGNAAVVWYNPKQQNVMRRYLIGDTLSDAEGRVNSPSNESKDTNKFGYGGRAYQPSIACIPGSDFDVITFSDDSDNNSYYEIYGVGQKIK